MDSRWRYDYDLPEPRPAGPLTVAWLVFHVASCKVMYTEYAFGAAKLRWDELEVPSTRSAALAYLEQSHPPLRSSLAKLSDQDLAVPRRTNWGEWWTTEKIIWTMIKHDVYHGAQLFTTRKLFAGLKRE